MLLKAQPTTQTIDFDGVVLTYRLVRCARTTIGFRFSAEGLQVRAPWQVSASRIVEAMQQRRSWLLHHWQRFQDSQRARASAPSLWRDGGSVFILGQPTHLVCEPSLRAGAHWESKQGQLSLRLAPGAAAIEVQAVFANWLKTLARERIAQQLLEFERAHGVKPQQWRLSSANTRWGSCTSRGTIRLNWRLLHFPESVLRYVVAHELSHLQHMNHSAEFWQRVAHLMPGFEAERCQLRQHAAQWVPVYLAE